LALPASLAAGDLGAWVVRRARLADPPTGRPSAVVAALVGLASGLALATLGVPVVLPAVNAARVRTSDPVFGLLALAALPAASAGLMAATGVGLGLVAGPRRGLSNALPYLTAALIALGVGLRFYGEPPVFFHSILVGYYPGNLYDEDIRLGLALVWSRLFQLACVTALLSGATAWL